MIKILIWEVKLSFSCAMNPCILFHSILYILLKPCLLLYQTKFMPSLWKAFTAFPLPISFFHRYLFVKFSSKYIHTLSFGIPHFLERVFHKYQYSYCSTVSISFILWSCKELGNDLIFMHWNCCDADQYCLTVSLYIFLPPPVSLSCFFSWTMLTDWTVINAFSHVRLTESWPHCS